MTSKSIFSTDLDFCPDCGTVLPLPSLEDEVTCKLCKYKINVYEFDRIKTVTKVCFNKPEDLEESTEKDSEKALGPTIDRKCAKCNHDQMVYTTRQTRSADEGQTVFFTCPKCRFQEIEYS